MIGMIITSGVLLMTELQTLQVLATHRYQAELDFLSLSLSLWECDVDMLRCISSILPTFLQLDCYYLFQYILPSFHLWLENSRCLLETLGKQIGILPTVTLLDFFCHLRATLNFMPCAQTPHLTNGFSIEKAFTACAHGLFRHLSRRHQSITPTHP